MPCYEDIFGSGGIAPHLLTSALHEGEWSASRPGRFTSGERAPGSHWIGGKLAPEQLWREEKSCPTGKRNLAVEPVARCYTN
jgi:hypothetical protein